MKHIDHCDSRKGDMAEFYAVTWLWDEGYEVFKNCGCTGEIDLIAVKDKKISYIDVKTEQPDYRYKGTTEHPYWYVRSKRTSSQIKKDVRLLGFNPITRKLRFVNHGKK
jgi:hypothetical protein